MIIKHFGFYLIVDFESRYFGLVLAAGATKDFATVPEKKWTCKNDSIGKTFKVKSVKNKKIQPKKLTSGK